MYDVIIIGAGPAGMSAAIYTARQKLKTLVLSGDVGGQTAKSWEVENYLGYSLIQGIDLAEKFKQHLEDFKDTVKFEVGVKVSRIAKQGAGFVVETKKGKRYQTKTVIIASGKTPRELNVPGEKEFRNKGITYCATCDAPLFKGKEVVVVGGGDSALDAAHQLTKIAKKVYLLVRKPEFKDEVDKVLLGNVKSAKNVEIIFNAETTRILGKQLVSGLEYKDKKSGEVKRLAVQGIFVEIGSIPAVEFCKDFVKLNQGNEIEIDKHNMTSVPGVFAAGDVTEVLEKQTVIAAGEGAKAGIAAAAYLSRQKK